MRGFIQGSLWGVILGGVGLSLLSLTAQPPALIAAAQGPQVPEFAMPRLAPVSPQVTEPVVMATAEPPASAARGVQSIAPAPQDSLPAVQTEPADLPDTTDLATDLDAPANVAAPALAAATETAPAAAQAVALPPAPETEDRIIIATDPVIPAETAPVILPAPQVSNLPEAVMQTQSDAVTVRVNRPGAETAEPVTDTAEAEALPEDAPALLRFAAQFENPDNVPMIGIVLIDDNAMGDAAANLAGLGFAPTIALNALADGVSDKMAAYRAAGLEVAVRADLPAGAQPMDVEVAFEAAFGLVPEAAMLFSDGTGVLQSDRSVAAQVMQVLAADGRGFVTVQQGLGNAARIAEQAGVATGIILRDLDGADENPADIARLLDQAALRARQSGRAILIGRVTPATVTALRDWAAGNDTSQLLIAPVSAILLDQIN